MSNCGCADPDIGNTQKTLSAFIQPSGAGYFNNVYPALAEGGSGNTWPGLKITAPSLKLRGARTPIRRRSSKSKQGVIRGYRTAAAADNSITLEFSASGCAGFMPTELGACGLDVYQKHSCCADGAVFEDDFAFYTVWTGVSPESLDGSDQVSYNDEDDNDLFVRAPASFVSQFEVRRLKFGEIAESAGVDSGGIVTGIAIYGQERCGNTMCGEKLGCGERWYAVTDEGAVLYKLNDRTALQSATIAGWTNNNFAFIAVKGNRLYVSANWSSLGRYFYGDLQEDGSPPATWTAVSTGVNFTPRGWHIAGDTLYLFGTRSGTNQGEIYIIDRNGTATRAYLNASSNTSVIDMASCGSTVMAVGDLGQILYGSTCDLVLTPLVSPTATRLLSIANQGLGRWWIGGINNDVYVSEDDGVSWTAVSTTGMPFGAAGTIPDITFVNENVGYVLWTNASNSSQLWATFDGGNTWSQDNDRIQIPPAGNNLQQVIVPCCNNQTEAVNSVFVTGIGSTGLGAIWQGSIQQC